jgi:hypothetical protein
MYGDADIASVPDSLLPLVEASLAKDPQSRPSAQQLLDRLTSGSSRTGSADDTTQVILARTWQSGSHASPPADRPVEANQVPPREPAAPSAWPHVARPAAQPPAAQPPAGAPPAVDTPTADAPSPVLPPGMVPSAAMPAVGVSSAAAPVPAAQAQASEKVPVGRRMATIATSALVAMRLRRPGRPDEPKS